MKTFMTTRMATEKRTTGRTMPATRRTTSWKRKRMP